MSNIEILKDQELEMISGGLSVTGTSGLNNDNGIGNPPITIPQAAIDPTAKRGVLNAFSTVLENTAFKGGLSNLNIVVGP